MEGWLFSRKHQSKVTNRRTMAEKSDGKDEETDVESEIIEGAEPEILTPEQQMERDLEVALSRAEAAEKEITYREADLQNALKKSAKEKSKLIRYSGMNLARRMLGVLDDVDRALATVSDSAEIDEKYISDLNLLRDRLWQELSTDGVTLVETKGVIFDPNLHDAITTIPATDELPSGIIVEVMEPGYHYKDRLLRAAKVVVSTD